MAQTEESDVVLVKSLKSGQKEALRTLYDRYAGLVYSVAYKILQNSQEAEDLTQDIFVTFWQQARFDPSRGSLSSFLGLLTRSRAIDKIRSRNTTQKFLERWQKLISEGSDEPLPLEQASLSERRKKLQQALRQLPDLERRVLEMNYFEGLSQAKIAQALDLTLGTVKNCSRKGIIQLKQLLIENLD